MPEEEEEREAPTPARVLYILCHLSSAGFLEDEEGSERSGSCAFHDQHRAKERLKSLQKMQFSFPPPEERL